MANGEMLREVAALLADNDLSIPERVTNRMLMAAIKQNYQAVNEMMAARSEDERALRALTDRMDEHIRDGERFPSLTWLLAHKPKTTIAAIAISFVVLMALYTAGVLSVAGALP